ncbi:23S rRNA (guanosine(2251)-2'-O)-methyltransferase RlmB [Fodinicurvata sp. EGI_FJ10296]|uniref:23S rRNA (guanosine(2251)-2'-O)-methyltransferase RlmB n=1 Tax=Fodinicurvata sp. EGI_FJ10296 TaxID=3231908 RepID=UPI00345401F9
MSVAPAPAKDPRPPVASPEPVDETAIYGHHAVAEAWTNPGRKIRHLVATRAALDALNDQIQAASAAGLRRPAPEIVQRATIDARLPEGTVHQGVLASVDPLSTPTFEAMLERARERFTLLIVLDQVTDPHNVGAILRTAAAFGAAALIMTERHAPPVSGTLAKIASGAVEHVPIIRVTNMARTLTDLTDSGVASLGLAEEAEQTLATVVSGLPHGLSTALVLGSEGAGLRRLTRENCTHLVRLPTSGPIASLNVSNAAAAALYELVRNIG